MNTVAKALLGIGAVGAISVASYGLGSSNQTPVPPPITQASITAEESLSAGDIKAKTVVQQVQAQKCNPNYSGCLRPDASDYDCAGGSGNGPYYTGKVRVIGSDIYDLDRDGDGWGCE